jgi:diguanylate cyclase (GGDEF)-like protein
MSNYFKESFKKFKADALAKGVYDLLKWLFITLLALVLSNFIPKDTSFSKVITYPFNISFFWVLIYTLIIIILSLITAYLLFRKKYQKVELDNFTDELTGLKNHKALKKYLENQLHEVAKSSNRNLSLILMDVDDFKQFSSDYGNTTSDRVLKKLGELLGNDKRATDEIFRFYNHGYEFLIVANDTSANNAFLAAERKRKLVEQTGFRIDNNCYSLKVSCGVTEYKKGDSYQSILDRVTSALQEAQTQRNKNCSKLIV